MSSKYFEGSSKIINLSIELGKLLGIIDSTYLRKPITKLRKNNRIKTIQSSLWIEGNSMTIKQVTDLFDNKRVLGPPKDIIEVKNAINTYKNISSFKALELKSYLLAHKMLMNELVANAGKFRPGSVGIFKGDQIAHMAPPAWNVSNLMNKLFKYLKKSEDSLLIKSCVFHYEMEFIHPFEDGNGRMGRLWQTILLMKENPVFEFLPIEMEIKENQKEYYDVLSKSDKAGHCTIFVEFMLGQIQTSLQKLVSEQRNSLSEEDRIYYFKEQSKQMEFTRKDYLNMFKDISTATATRDLRKGTELNIWKKVGENRTSRYIFIN